MTLRLWLQQIAQQETLLLSVFIGIPLFTLLGFLLPRKARYARWMQWTYSVLIHAICLPGTFSLALLAYQLLFTRENLLDVNVLVYFLPPLSMGLTLFLLRQQITFQLVPGFRRLIGLMGLMAMAFFILLILNKLFVGIFFGGSIIQLLGIGLLMYLAIRWCWARLTQRG